jgi:Rieske Fe-S protein
MGSRRTFLTSLLAGLGLAASYGVLAAYAVAYLFPPHPRRTGRRLFVGRRQDFRAGTARPVIDQKGRSLIIVAREDRLEAFDTRCPHLGCRVHWEPEHERFFCPCHQGVFDAAGVATAGPPATAAQSLARVPLEVDAVSGTVFLTSEA